MTESLEATVDGPPLVPPSAEETVAPGVESSAVERRRAGQSLGPGDVVGRYLIASKLGAGGMGVVYAAYDPELDRKLALKLLLSDASGDSLVSEGRARLLREAQALAVAQAGLPGEQLEAAAAFDQALGLAGRVLGPDHPTTRAIAESRAATFADATVSAAPRAPPQARIGTSVVALRHQ